MTISLRLAAALTLAMLPACGGTPPPGDSSAGSSPQPAPTGEIFAASDGTRFTIEIVATNLQVPWGLAFAPDGRIFLTERPGRVRIVQNNRLLAEPALTVDDVVAQGESGLMGIALHPQFATNRLIFLVYTGRGASGRTVNRVVRYREVGNVLGERIVLLDDVNAAAIHDGSRLKFGPDGKLYITMGDAAVPSLAQDLSSPNGKILRMNEDGTMPADNPFPSLVYSYGHRNPQGIDWHPVSGELWETEHGATGNDEINRIVPGGNYGWPDIQGAQTAPGKQPPILFYNPAIAPSGGSFYAGGRFPTFRNDFFFATLRGEHLRRLRFDPADPRRVLGQEALLAQRFGRLRDVVQGPDGLLYVTTSNRDGRGNPASDDDRVLRLVPVS